MGMVMNRSLIGILSFAIVSCATMRASDVAAPKLSWAEARENTAGMEGREISMCGWLRAEFEACTLAPDPYGDPALAAANEIWLAPKSDVCSLEKVTAHPTKRWADISGKLQYSNDPNKGFGHFGSYRSAISNAVVKMRKTPCDN
jgi:hypothetical protein